MLFKINKNVLQYKNDHSINNQFINNILYHKIIVKNHLVHEIRLINDINIMIN